jgi:N6-adenosine-specific RNA methylase IME4
MNVTPINLSSLELDPATQPRLGLDLAVVADYAEAMAGGAVFPPVVVYSDGTSYWLADGWHRVAGARQAKLEEVNAEVREGGRDEAQWHAVSANQTHGLRRKREDVQRAIKLALLNPHGVGESNRKIAAHVGCDDKTVGAVREGLEASAEIPQIDARQVTRNGMTYTMDTARIGRPAPVLTQTLPLEELREQAEQVRRREIVAESSAIRAERREGRREERVEKMATLATPTEPNTKRYHVILADPPWRYQHAESDSRAVENQYPTMALGEICALKPWERPAVEVAAPDAVLFLWTTAPKLEEAFSVIRAWGFSYRTSWVWDKEAMGMGYWGRIQHEHLLIATRGAPVTPRPEHRPRSVFRSPKSEHSAKPDCVMEAIEAMFPEPELLKVELFQRTPRQGWDAWGNEVK